MSVEVTGLPEGFDADALGRRALERCDRVAEHTDEPGRVTRLFLSEATAAVHAELRGWMERAGLAVRVDAAGNVIGRRTAADVTEGTKALLLGSHIDTVPGAGKYDGVLGVLAALSAVEGLAGVALPFHVDVVAFSEEEGVRFGLPYIGSCAVAGTFDAAWLERRDADGVSLKGALEKFGLDPGAIIDAAYDSAEVLGYTELHLEQGPVLENAGRAVGVVSGIQGQSRLRLRFEGAAAHAGTMPMDQRRDALVCASRFAVAVQDYGRSIETLRATVGLFEVWPNVRNVVPGKVELALEVRHQEDGVRLSAVEALLAAGQRLADEAGITLGVMERQSQPATPTDPALTGALTDAVRAAGVEPLTLPSGAGHDAVAVAGLSPVAMVFVRHPDGVSHHPDERVLPEDVAVSVEVLARYLLGLADRLRGGTLPS